jgi:multidrug resistance efflux pump
VLLPAQRAIAEATFAQAQVDQAKTVVYAGVDGMLQQFTLRVGDVVNPAIRPAGVLIPESGGREMLVAGFGQIEAQVIKIGMIGEAACSAKPFVIVPLVVTEIQDVIAAGQLAVSERLVDLEQMAGSGTIFTYLKPLEEGALSSIPPGSSCHVTLYTSNHERLESEELGTPTRIALHLVDTVGLAHAMILRIQALLIPVTTLVFSGGH